MARRVFVKVLAWFGDQGDVEPQRLVWDNGREYPIEQVLEMRTARGGTSTRYLIRIQGRDVYLYRSGDQWYMAGKD